MKRGEMPRHIGAEIFRKPFRCAMQLRIAVVLTGNQKRRHFKPDVRLMPEILERVEHRRELRKTSLVIKRVAKCLEIDIRRVHVPVEFRARVISNIAGCYCHSLDPMLAASLRYIDRVLRENHRIIVSKRDRSAPEPLRRQRDLLGRCGICELVPFARYRDVPVLTKSAAEIASRGAE